MGFGAQKRKTKLSHDPNNTTWSRSTSTYGHRLLTQQGWSPGSYLGASDAAHSEHYTAANASHIRVLLREDNLGLGAKVGGDRAETFGLSLFSGVLGRLNGKSEEVLKEEVKKVKEVEVRRGYAGMGFVSGGWLVGDRIERFPKAGEAGVKVEEGEEKKSKRKAEEDEELAPPTKKSKKSKKDVEQQVTSNNENEAARVKRKEKKRKNKQNTVSEEEVSKTSTDDRAVQKQEKRARKEERRKRKEDRRARKEAKALQKLEPEAATAQQRTTTTTTYPYVGNRQAVRQRYIQQKRMASMDPRAMQEIFMVKAVS